MVRIHAYGFLLFFNIYFLVINGKFYIFADNLNFSCQYNNLKI